MSEHSCHAPAPDPALRLEATQALLEQGNQSSDLPLLIRAGHFKQHRAVNYDLLDRLRLKRKWKLWLDFFLTRAPG